MTAAERSIVESMRAWARIDPERIAFRWLPELTERGETVSYRQLDLDAGRVGAALQQRSEVGDRVLLVQPPGLGFIRAFLGCLYSGRIPVPVYPVLNSASGLASAGRIAADCGATLAWLAEDETASLVAGELGLTVAFEPAELPCEPVDLDPEAVAFLQYTSGSTSAPKGVMVTHRNLLANVESITSAFGHDENSVILSWLPTFHDMGLIGNVLHPLQVGSGAYLAAPTSFVRRPVAWLQAIAAFGVHTSGAPNFAFDLVIAALEKHGVPEMDLSCWKVAYSGAEPVHQATMRRFADLLAASGFDSNSLLPCYGLAEATLLVSSVTRGLGSSTRRSSDGAQVVSCGRPRGCVVAIADDDDNPLPDGQIGEIRVSGSSVASGYWAQPETSRSTFTGRVEGSDAAWLRTGDLGFISDGELHVADRIKDVIIVRGRNHHPHDIERLAMEREPAFRAGAVIAVENADGDGVVLMGELRPGRGLSDGTVALVAAVSSVFGLSVSAVVEIARGQLPRTTSGKLRRFEARRRYLAGQYAPVTGPDRTARAVAVITEALAGHFDPALPLVAQGLDSLRAIWLAAELAEQASIEVPVHILLRGATLAELLAEPESRSARAAGAHPDRLGLSQAQQSLVFLNALSPGTDEYNITSAWELLHPTDHEAFDEALRHAILGQPQLALRILPDGDRLGAEQVSERAVRDGLGLVAVPVREQRLAEHLEDAAAMPFDLYAGPPFRVYVWQTSQRRVYQLVVHHISTDLWSLGLLLREVAHAYDLLIAGRRADAVDGTSANLHFGYQDYIADQQAYLKSPAADERDRYLKSLIPTGLAPSSVRTDRPHRRQRQVRSARVSAELSEWTSTALGRVDHIALLTAMWGLCLRRYGTATDTPIVVGVPITGRSHGRHAAIAGLCTNTVPVAVDADLTTPLDVVVNRIREQLLAGLEAAQYPLARAVEALRPAREPGRTPLLETLVTVQENPIPEAPGLLAVMAGEPAELSLGALSLRSIPVARSSSRYDLDLVITPRGDRGWLVTLDYAADLFEEMTAQSMLSGYLSMVDASVGGVGRTVADTFVRSTADQALIQASGQAATAPLEPAVVDRLAALARHSPQLPAVEWAAGTLSFGELGARVSELGTAMQLATDRTSGPGSDLGAAGIRLARRQVALLLEPTADFVVGMFSAWSVGLGVLPLPVDFPDERLRVMLADCRPGLLLCSHGLAGRARALLADSAATVVMTVDESATASIPLVRSAPDSPAFTVYTSGSTGRPKGVLIRQDQLAALIAWSGQTWQLGSWVRIAQTLSLGFDFGLQELFTALTFGGAVVLPGPGDRRSARDYAAFLRRNQITVLFSTPSFADELIAAGERLDSLRLVLLGGEVLRRPTVTGLRELVAEGCRIFNGYGPTEASVNCLMYEVPVGELPELIPVGRASGASRLELLDQAGRAVPVGAVGELWIGGPGVAAGYLNSPELTGTRFVDRSEPDGSAARWYRTGDVGYLRPDGQFVVLGRVDRQVKLRSFRVELGEVEQALRAVPGVDGAAALTIGRPARLIAFVSGPTSTGAVIENLAARLPQAMLPEQVVVLEQLPLTANGKLDEAELRMLAEQAELISVGPSASVAEIEGVICQVWADVLYPQPISPEVNVFDVGAYSLAVSRVHARLQRALTMTFPIHNLFEYPRPRELASRLVDHGRQSERTASGTATTVKDVR